MVENGAKKMILLVDDNEIQRVIIETMLADEYTVTTANSGKEAIDFLLKGHSPHLVLLDIVMPEMDGWETFNRLKAISCIKDVPIAFVTSLDDTTEMDRAFMMGAADFIAKPVDKDELLDRIKKILEKFK